MENLLWLIFQQLKPVTFLNQISQKTTSKNYGNFSRKRNGKNPFLRQSESLFLIPKNMNIKTALHGFEIKLNKRMKS